MNTKVNINLLNDFHNYFTCLAYTFLGSFYTPGLTTFRVYAPHATKVSVVGDFNSWNPKANPMKKIDYRGVWEVVISDVNIYDNYKYCITSKSKTFLKQDPYSYHNQTDGQTSSKVYDIDSYKWNDDEWIKKRNSKNLYKSPINIYEMHLGSWIKKNNGEIYNYHDLAKKIASYVKKMNYTHVEFMPLMEHPYLGSWGYQVTGYYSVTSRYGTPNDLKYLIDYLHQQDIGVIFDWVPAHFTKDDFGLVEFDGDYLYEDSFPTRMENKTWGTRLFNYAKPEIKSFLISSADFYLSKYHIDGIRCDAVASMLYLDYDRQEWVPNVFGNNYNLEAISFLRDLNRTCFLRHGNIMMIAEESTAFPKVTHRIEDGGLGFNFKWNMGWMNDTLRYIQVDPLFKNYDHSLMTFAMSYNYSENYILPISHDEVVHLKKSLISKMPGEYLDKYNNLKAYLGYMITHPGKKLLFMGCEIGQFNEWNEVNQLDWNLLNYPIHLQLQEYVSQLNKLYIKYKPMHEQDYVSNGFQWIYSNNNSSNTYCYIRRDEENKEILVVLNFSGENYLDFELKNEFKKFRGTYTILLDSDCEKFGGTGFITQKEFKASNGTLKIDLPRLACIILKSK